MPKMEDIQFLFIPKSEKALTPKTIASIQNQTQSNWTAVTHCRMGTGIEKIIESFPRIYVLPLKDQDELEPGLLASLSKSIAEKNFPEIITWKCAGEKRNAIEGKELIRPRNDTDSSNQTNH